MKLGVFLPLFRDNADDALALADEAERAGLDGVFAFDHLWPMGTPTRPALSPMPVLAAVAARTERLHVGTLVARVALFGTATLVERFLTLEALAPGRVIAGLGTGDDLSKNEQVAFGLGCPSVEERWELLDEAMTALEGRVELWCGAGRGDTDRIARAHGATLNFWSASPTRVADAATRGPVNWAGPLEGDVAASITALSHAGATWVIAASPGHIGELAEWRRATD